MTEIKVICGDCGKELDERPDLPESERKPCPNCGSLKRTVVAEVEDKVELHDKLKVRAYPPNSKRWTQEVTSGDDLYKKTNEWNKLERNIDRTNSIYSEEIKNKDDKVIKSVKEPLDQHRNHGSAKKNSKRGKKEGRVTDGQC